MSLSDAARKTVIDYYYKNPNAKAVMEDEDVGHDRKEVENFLEGVYDHLVKTMPSALPPTIIIPKPDVIIEIPSLEHFRFGHGRDIVRRRRDALFKVSQQIHKAKEWLSRETKYLQDNCNHSYASTGDGDGSSQDFCQDCSKR